MKTFRMILTVALATLVAGSAMAQCTGDTSTGFGTSGTWNFSNNGTSSQVVAQRFTGQCTAGLTTVDVGMATYPDSLGGAAPMRTGDILRATLYDASWNVIGYVDSVVDFDGGSAWVTFDFTHRTFALAAGTDYHIGLEAHDQVWGAVITANGLGMDGSMYYDEGSGWVENSSDDIYMTINWDESAVPADDYAWGTLKAIYR